MKTNKTFAEIMADYENPSFARKVIRAIRGVAQTTKFFSIRHASAVTFFVRTRCLPRRLQDKWELHLLKRNCH